MRTGLYRGNLKETGYLEDLAMDGGNIKWILKKQSWGFELNSTGSGWGQVADCCERGDELLASEEGVYCSE